MRPIKTNADIRVLLVEDDPVTRWMIRKYLKNKCCFATAVSAGQAYTKCQSFQPHIVFLDIDLPDENGHIVLDWMGRHHPHMRVIMFSSHSDIYNISHALENGAQGFLSKPFSGTHFIEYINHFDDENNIGSIAHHDV